MKRISFLLAAVLPVLLSSCATPPRQTFRNNDNAALIVESLDAQSCQVLAPTAISHVENTKLLDQAKSFPQHQTAVVILENFQEGSRLGPEFRDRTLGWFIGLRGLGYQHIVFLQGRGVSDPNGLPTLAEYD